ncbi:ABC transporter substrate-binding protein [Photobacterium minamisatsumaniensis]|uniref:ABC transporter substrate-binding protein n=1 Tax=Photobacterium minamisatsumaniensis TaxID=2910233 RepID=UPI003D0EA67F
MFKNTTIALAFALLAWLLLDYQAIDTEKTLTIGGPFEFTSQDLSKDGFIYTRMQVAETLLEVQPDGKIAEKLAAKWRTSDDNLVWYFDIRPDVLFHDGEALTAESIVISLSHALNKPGVLQQLPLKRIYSDNQQVVVELSEPYRPLLSVLAHFSTAILSPNSFDKEGSVFDINGTGPYQVSLLAPPHKLNVTRFNQYWGDKPAIEHVHYLTGHRAESRALQAQSGQADLIYTLDPASIEVLKRANHIDVYSESIPRTVLIKLNNEHKFLNHKDVRRAMSLALNREGISEHIVRVPDSEAYQLFPPSLSNWHLSGMQVEQQDRVKAQQLLAQQGWQPNADGILERDGERFNVNLVTYADRPELTVIATAVQAQLRQVGIEVTISVDNSSAIPSRHHDGTLELALIARNFGIISDPLALLIDDTRTHKGSDWGPMNWSSEALSVVLERMMNSTDQEYNSLSQQAANHLADEMPLIPVVFYTQQVAINERVMNFQFDPFENNYRVSEMYFAD